ncbi:MAG: hypothetical protein LBL65_01865 [Campylobacteraceae bacterium]|jgi:hypothetical protein|nr:hypothetical protein [Campylobacteraceae bacterium]
MLSSMADFKVLYRLNLKIFFLLFSFFLIGCNGGSGNSNGVENSSGNVNTNNVGTSNGGLCGDINYEGVKKTTNFPIYDLPANTFPTNHDFTYNHIPNISAYDTLLQGNGLIRYQSNDTVSLYIYSSGGSLPDIGVVTHKNSDSSYTAIINYNSNPSLLSAIKPAGVRLSQYVLTEHYTGERTFVINHIAQYKNSLKELGFKETNGGGDGYMEKNVGNCVYSWLYVHHDHRLDANNGYMYYSWAISDKTSENIVPLGL